MKRLSVVLALLVGCSSGGADRYMSAGQPMPPAGRQNGPAPLPMLPMMTTPVPPISQAGGRPDCASGTDVAVPKCAILSSLGHPVYDDFFWGEVRLQQGFWPVTSVVDIVSGEDCEGEGNAFASPTGQVGFGIRMFNKLIGMSYGGVPVVAVLAHEFGHRLQQTFGWSRTTRTPAASRLVELEADGWSGFYAGWVKGYSNDHLNNYVKTMYRQGDLAFNEPDHHGTHVERFALTISGYALAEDALRKGIRPTYLSVHQQLVSLISGAGLVSHEDLAAAGIEVSELPTLDPALVSRINARVQAFATESAKQ